MKLPEKDQHQYIETLQSWRNNAEVATKFARNIEAKLVHAKGRGSPSLVKALHAMHPLIIDAYVDLVRKGVYDPSPEDMRRIIAKAASPTQATIVHRHRDWIVNHYYLQCTRVYQQILFPKPTHS